MSYFKNNISIPRPCIPTAPSWFQWGSGRQSARSDRKDKSETKVRHANKNQMVSFGHADADSGEATPGTDFVVQKDLKKRALGIVNVAAQVD